MREYAQHNFAINSFAEYLECDPRIIFDIHLELKVDQFSDLEEMSDLRNSSKIYSEALAGLKKAHNGLKGLSSLEMAALKISRSDLLDNIKQGVIELDELHQSRHAMLSQNRSNGGRNIKADIIAELVARVFIKLERSVTFGSSAYKTGQPSTPFGRAVQEALKTFHVFDKPKNGALGETTFWRYPAKRAFEKYRNAN